LATGVHYIISTSERVVKQAKKQQNITSGATIKTRKLISVEYPDIQIAVHCISLTSTAYKLTHKLASDGHSGGTYMNIRQQYNKGTLFYLTTLTNVGRATQSV
jgi:hypothetical protein